MFIKCTDVIGDDIWVNAKLMIAFGHSKKDKTTTLAMVGEANRLAVKDTPEEILANIAEAKRAKRVRYAY
jgi:hypothetical protein